MKIDDVTIKILREIALGETKIKRIAEKIKVPRTTIIARLQKMFEENTLVVSAAVSYYKLGLQPVAVISDRAISELGIPYAAYTAKFLSYDGVKYLVLFAFPLKHIDKYLKKIGNAEVIKVYDPVIWIPDNAYVNIEKGKIRTDWIALSRGKRGKERLYLPETPEVKVKLDQIDLYTLEKLQVNSFEKLKKIADYLGIHPNLLLYHYHKHVRPLLLGNNVDFYFWKLDEAPVELYSIQASNHEELEAILSVLRKTLNFKFAYMETGGSHAIVALQVPSWEKLDFMEALLNMKKHGLREVSLLGIIDPKSVKRYIIPFKYFGKRGWLYAKASRY